MDSNDELAMAAHHIRGPLANIKLACQLLKRIIPESHEKYLALIESECDRALQTSQDILLWERSCNWQVRLQPISLRIWLDKILQGEQSKIERRHLEFKPLIKAAQIQTDPEILGYILSELVHNACKYSPPDEAITVLADSRHIVISNRGDISDEAFPYLFERFYRAPGGDRWQQGGTGLGLALVKRLALLMGYTIEYWCKGGWVSFEVNFNGDIAV